MNIKIQNINDIPTPPFGYGYMFIDSADKKLKIKKQNSIIEYSNNLDDIQLLDLTDYTAFEVMPNKEEIPSGAIDDVTGLTFNNNIPACTIHKMSIKSVQTPDDCDVIVDWGDGEWSSIKNKDYITYSNGSFELEHDYAQKMTEKTQRYIIKIYGRNYWAFRHEKYQSTGNNLMSRIFDPDLPLASHIANIASTCFGAMRLLNVNFSNYYRILNLNSCFCKCKNLIKANGFGLILNDENGSAGGTFEQCFSLIETDFRFPNGVSSIGSTFANCRNLPKDINDLLPLNGFEKRTITINATFSTCRSLTGINFDKKLWNDNLIKWIVKPSGTTGPFTGSSLKNLVPESWGGTASNNIIEKSLEEKYNDLLARVEALENK